MNNADLDALKFQVGVVISKLHDAVSSIGQVEKDWVEIEKAREQVKLEKERLSEVDLKLKQEKTEMTQLRVEVEEKARRFVSQESLIEKKLTLANTTLIEARAKEAEVNKKIKELDFLEAKKLELGKWEKDLMKQQALSEKEKTLNRESRERLESKEKLLTEREERYQRLIGS